MVDIRYAEYSRNRKKDNRVNWKYQPDQRTTEYPDPKWTVENDRCSSQLIKENIQVLYLQSRVDKVQRNGKFGSSRYQAQRSECVSDEQV